MRTEQDRIDALYRIARKSYDRAARLLNIAPPELISDFEIDSTQVDSRGVAFNPLWLLSLIDRHCDSTECGWSSTIGIFGHELWHHEHHNNIDYLIRPQDCELDADFNASRALGLTGLAHHQFMNVIADLAGHEDGLHTHPAAPERLMHIRLGFVEGQRQRIRIHGSPGL